MTLEHVKLAKLAKRNQSDMNLLYLDTEGYYIHKDPMKASYFTGGTNTFFMWICDTPTNEARLMGVPLGTKDEIPYTGTGAQTSFTGTSLTNVPLNLYGLTFATVINASFRGWISETGAGDTIANQKIGEGTGAATVFNLYARQTRVKPSTFTLTHTRLGSGNSATDDGAGNITGTNIASGTINYDTGAVAVTFTGAPDISTPIACGYTMDNIVPLVKTEYPYNGDGSSLNFTGSALGTLPVKARSLEVSYVVGGNTYYLTDNGAGALAAVGTATGWTSGTINYATGDIALVFATAPDTQTRITAIYQASGLNKSDVNPTTGAVSLTFDSGYEPDNGSGIVFTYAPQNVPEFGGNDVVNMLRVAAPIGKYLGLRTARSYVNPGSEAFTETVYPIYTAPDRDHIFSFYARTDAASPVYCYIRFWQGEHPATEIALPAANVDVLTGAGARVTGPGAVACVRFVIGSTLTRFACHVKSPALCRIISMEFVSSAQATTETDCVLYMTGLYSGIGTALSAYSPSPEIVYMPRPTGGLGTVGQVFVNNGDGTGSWQDASTISGGGAITELNGLLVAKQAFAVGTSGTDFAVTSTGATHTFNLPTVSSSNRGAVTSTLFDKWEKVAGGTLTADWLPNADNTYALGSITGSNKRWSNLYLSSGLYVGKSQAGNVSRFELVTTGFSFFNSTEATARLSVSGLSGNPALNFNNGSGTGASITYNTGTDKLEIQKPSISGNLSLSSGNLSVGGNVSATGAIFLSDKEKIMRTFPDTFVEYTAGSSSWTIPADVTKVIVWAVGAGGNGAAAIANTRSGGGGGSGGMAIWEGTVTPGGSITYTVGQNSGSRTTTVVVAGNTLTANGGSDASGTTGGSGGSASGGTSNFSGDVGGDGLNASTAYGGGGAGVRASGVYRSYGGTGNGTSSGSGGGFAVFADACGTSSTNGAGFSTGPSSPYLGSTFSDKLGSSNGYLAKAVPFYPLAAHVTSPINCVPAAGAITVTSSSSGSSTTFSGGPCVTPFSTGSATVRSAYGAGAYANSAGAGRFGGAGYTQSAGLFGGGSGNLSAGVGSSGNGGGGGGGATSGGVAYVAGSGGNGYVCIWYTNGI